MRPGIAVDGRAPVQPCPRSFRRFARPCTAGPGRRESLAQRPAFFPYVPRSVQRAIDAPSARGLVHAARIQTTAYVAHVGLHAVAALMDEEDRLVCQAPLREQRYRSIGEALASVVNYEIAQLGFGR